MKENIKMFFYFIKFYIVCIWMSIPFVRNYYDKKINKVIINNFENRKEFIDTVGYQRIREEERRRKFLINECLENVLNN